MVRRHLLIKCELHALKCHQDKDLNSLGNSYTSHKKLWILNFCMKFRVYNFHKFHPKVKLP